MHGATLGSFLGQETRWHLCRPLHTAVSALLVGARGVVASLSGTSRWVRANRFKHSRQRLISRYIDLWNRRSRRLGLASTVGWLLGRPPPELPKVTPGPRTHGHM